MLLEPTDAQQFSRLHKTLMFFVNQRLKMITDPLATPEELAARPNADRIKLRDAFLTNLDLIETFDTENPFHLRV